jgi:GH43 family beta-xylosidase
MSLPPKTAVFKNPIVDSGMDPYVAVHDGYFYYCYVAESAKDVIYIARSETLEDIGKAQPTPVWGPVHDVPYARNIWAPELHRIDGKWYIYFAADDTPTNIGPEFPDLRMYVLEADEVMGPYHMKGKIAANPDRWAIDGTVLYHPSGKRYFVWSGWKGEMTPHQQQLYIAEMSNPWTLTGERVMISQPEYDWEMCEWRGQLKEVNEGPQVLIQGTRVHVIYSASFSGNDSYCLGQLELVGDDPLDPGSWRKFARPIFASQGNEAGTGHGMFLLSETGDYGWMVYHAARYPGAGWDRHVRMVAFTWDTRGKLRFLRVSRLAPLSVARRALAGILKLSR